MKTEITINEALQRCSPRLKEKLIHSVQLVQKAEKLALIYNPTDGFFNTFSGGKDSQAMYHVLELAGVKFKTYFSPTTVDPPEVIRFIRQKYPEVEFIIPKKSMYTIAVERGMLPSMTVRYCCAEYKENAGAGQCTTIGVRKAESVKRSKRKEVEISNHKFQGNLDELEGYRNDYEKKKKGKVQRSDDGMVKCINGKETMLISPIIEWTDADVWEFLNNVVRVPHCELYEQGQTRIGCILCPMSTYKKKVLDIHRYPHNKHLWIKAIMDIRRGGGLTRRFTMKLSDISWGGYRQDKEETLSFRVHAIAKNGRKEDGNSTTKKTGNRKPNSMQQFYLNEKLWNTKKNMLNIHCNEQIYNELGDIGGGGCNVLIKQLDLPYQRENVESYNGEYTQEEIDIAEAIFAWWISGKGYTKWYADNIQQLKLF